MKKYTIILVITLLFFACNNYEKAGVLLFVDDNPIYIEEYFANIERKKNLWNYYESSSNYEQEMKYHVLRELIIDKVLMNYGERAGISISEEDINLQLSEIIGEKELLSSDMVNLLRDTYTIEYILANALKDRIDVTDEDIEPYLRNMDERQLTPPSIFLIEFIFDNEASAEEFFERVSELEDIDEILEKYNIYKLSNPNTDMNLLGYVSYYESYDIITDIDEIEVNSFSEVIEGISGFHLYFISDKREAKIITEQEKYQRAYLSAKIAIEREQKEIFLKELINRTNFTIVVEDDSLSLIIDRIKREFEEL